MCPIHLNPCTSIYNSVHFTSKTYTSLHVVLSILLFPTIPLLGICSQSLIKMLFDQKQVKDVFFEKGRVDSEKKKAPARSAPG